MKKGISILLCAVLLLGISPVACGASPENQEETTLHPAYAAPILEEYASELAEIEAEYGVAVDLLDRPAVEQIQQAAVEHYTARPRYAELVDQIALAYCDQQVLGRPDQIAPFVNEKTEVRNYKREVVESFGPRSGKYVDCAENKKTVAKGATFTFTLSGTYKGLKLDNSFSINSSYSLTGPQDTDRLKDGKLPNGAFYIGVLWGTLIHVSWDVYETNTGRFLTHTDFHHIDAELTGGVERVRGYTPKYSETKVNGKYVIYVEAGLAGYTTSSQWSDRTELTNSLREHPELILEGRN